MGTQSRGATPERGHLARIFNSRCAQDARAPEEDCSPCQLLLVSSSLSAMFEGGIVQRSSPARKLEGLMSIIDQALKSNEQFAKNYDPKLGAGPPHPAIAVLTCMDPRLSDLEGILGLKRADMDVIRNGGPSVTDEVLGKMR
jgi:hypothetical protein